MSGKKGSPPPRPPAPKGGLDKLLSKPSSNSPSLSIRFKSLEEDSDEELSFLDARKSSTEKEPTQPITIDDSKKLTRLHSTSKSLDEDRLYTTSHRNLESKEEKRTLFAGIKDRLSDKFPDTMYAITRKWEELSFTPGSENNNVENVKPIPQGEVTKALEEKAALSSSFSSPNLGQTFSATKAGSMSTTLENGFETDEKPAVGNIATPTRTRVPSIAEEGKDIDESIEIVDDFYCEEAFEDFNGSIQQPIERQTPKPVLRQRSAIQRLIKSKNPSDSPPSTKTMSMSTLMKNVSEEAVDFEGNVFFDAKESEKVAKSENDVSDPSSTPDSKKSMAESLKDFKDCHVPIQTLALYSVALFLYLILPLPSFFSGFVAGLVLTSAGWTVYIWVTKPPEPKQPIKIDPLEDLPPMTFPEMRDIKVDDGKYKGWMNELPHYEPDNYHINQCHSVFVRLDSSTLRLSRPKVGVPKRAMWDETLPTPHFIHQRYINLEGSRLFLLPPGLVEKRLWSKKYPLCIALAKPNDKSTPRKSSDSGSPPAEEVPGTAVKDVSGFEIVTEEACDNSVLYLFARTNREKEEWYYRLLGATRGKPLPNHLLEIRKALEFKPKHRRSNSDQPTKHKRNSSTDSLGSLASEDNNGREEASNVDIGTFAQYMALLMPAEQNRKAGSPVHGKRDSVGKEYKTFTGNISCDPQLVWLNALLGRCFWDFLLQKYWRGKIQEKLEKKLSKIHVPYFMEGLRVTDIDLGSIMPVIRRPSHPYLDERGFWVELDVAYSGGFRMTIETKLNLMKLKEKSQPKPESPIKVDRKRSAVTDSEEEDSAESSTDEEGEETPTSPGEDGSQAGGTGKKLLKVIDKITQSRYFQSATDNKYIKKAMEGVSNTRLILTVELHSLVGTLAINIPPPPSDRLWYGFRGNPLLRLVAKPKVGEREVTVTHVTEWIEKKLAIEFQRVFVIPNMDDLVIPVMMSGMAADSVPPLNVPGFSSV